MALITKLTHIPRNSRLQGETEATYNIVSSGGNKYVQINTYGSKERLHKNVVSQTLQFNEASAKQLVEILRREFGI